MKRRCGRNSISSGRRPWGMSRTHALQGGVFFSYHRAMVEGRSVAICAFPRWCLSAAYLREHVRYAESVLTFYPSSSDTALVRSLLKYREPTNLGMVRYHDLDAFAGALPEGGWRESFYERYWRERRQLAPSIAMYCETPALEYDPNNCLADFSAADTVTLRVLNVIGLGFDAANQPDAERFGMFEGEAVALRAAMRTVFSYILAVVLRFRDTDAPITWMHVPEFGCGAFAGRYGVPLLPSPARFIFAPSSPAC